VLSQLVPARPIIVLLHFFQAFGDCCAFSKHGPPRDVDAWIKAFHHSRANPKNAVNEGAKHKIAAID